MILPIVSSMQEQVQDFFIKQWGSSQMVVSSGTYDCAKLEGFVYMKSNQIHGLVTYVIRDEEVEIISLDSLIENSGIGSHLLHAIEEIGMQHRARQLIVITTNDNLRALGFYQRRGYRLERIIHDAVTRARKLKSTIPQVGYDKIPLLDEILLTKKLKE
ncbi:GNAT family N-acetyltransferase [Exiguobacterium sp. MMG028]|uniref:GNAT family N-acetyltransferase n=1 Tax=Exiguobacterium sp. MMG028 TaxID=3021979 RepID=UPI0022FEB8D7|nr:GNAT family N-acetyltransferase [Exiguobacterium sp. MMG028]MDA5559776.1 GNAT family N-acetyltransferase [Exiguobacterium sp. MMG028]